MNATLLLQPLRPKLQSPFTAEKGFTLIELLVVIIIIGILAAIALPSFLNQAAKAKQSEAKSYVGAVMRAQQSYRMEKPQFALTTIELELGIPTQTQDYTYSIVSADDLSTQFTAITTDPSTLRSYAAMIRVTQGLTMTVACQTKRPSNAVPTINAPGNSPPRCQGGNSEEMR